jgi:hypothetical protein
MKYFNGFSLKGEEVFSKSNLSTMILLLQVSLMVQPKLLSMSTTAKSVQTD